MRVLLSWLREFVDVAADAQEIARRLTMAGLEVEAVERLDQGLDQVVVGEVRQKTPIPETKLNVCRVFDGQEELQIVCGAQNYQVGDHVPLAKVGANLPGNKAIGKAKLRGVESFGMLCSSRELGFDDGVDGLLLLPRDTQPGTAIAKVLGRDDVAYEINVTPNRADALSHLGVARELAALFGVALKVPAPALPSGDGAAPARVQLGAPDLCPAFGARLVEGVTVGPSPLWLRTRLEALGQRSINNVVDATNYVLFELGQPLHAYDFDRLSGGLLDARRAKAGETLKTLDGKERALEPGDLVIADAERPVGLAGVMGGEDSEVKAGTTRLLLESAQFSPQSVRKTARRVGIHSEASHRFERGVDPEGIQRALDRLTQIILQTAGGRVVGDRIFTEARPFQRTQIRLRHARITEMLGTEVPWDESLGILSRLGLTLRERTDRDALLEVPGARQDLTTEIDLIEEIVRVRGFESIPAKSPSGSGTDAREPHLTAAEKRLRIALQAAGFDEAVNFAFVTAEDLARIRPEIQPIRLKNPIAADMSVMRTTLLGGLLRNVQRNLRHSVGTLRLYELGRIYLPLVHAQAARFREAHYTVADEPKRLAFAAVGQRVKGWTGGKDAFDFYDLKGALEQVLDTLHPDQVEFRPATDQAHLHPRAAARLFVGGLPAGTFGELHPTVAEAFELPRGVFVGELDADLLLQHARLVPRYHPLPRFPASLRDVALVVEERVSASDVLAEIRDADPQGIVEDATVFDVYRGAPLPEGKKNLAFSLRYRAPERTLTDDEVNRLHQSIVERLGARFGASLRQ